MTECKAILSIVSAIAAIVAAALWFWSTTVKVPPSDEPDERGLNEASITSEGADVIATARHQNFWNRYAAFAASVSALAQGASLLIQTD